MQIYIGINRTTFFISLLGIITNMISVSPWLSLQHFNNLQTDLAKTAAIFTILSPTFGFLLTSCIAFQNSKHVLLFLAFLSTIATLVYMGIGSRKDNDKDWHFWVGWSSVFCYSGCFLLILVSFWVDGISDETVIENEGLEVDNSDVELRKIQKEAELPNYGEITLPEDDEIVGTMTSMDRKVLDQMVNNLGKNPKNSQSVSKSNSFSTIIQVASRKPSVLNTTSSSDEEVFPAPPSNFQ